LTPPRDARDHRAVIVDADGHYVEPKSVWTDYLDPALREQVRLARGEGGAEWVELGRSRLTLHLPASGPGVSFQRGSLYSVGDTLTPGGLDEGRPRHRHYDESAAGGRDPLARLAVHDAEGVDAAVLFPTLGLFAAVIEDPALAAGACRALNRFASDYCAAAPAELYAVAMLPSQDPGAAALELRRAVREGGLVAGCLRPNPARDGRALDHPSFDALWAEAQDLDVPICFHNALNVDLPQTGLDRARSFPLGHAIVHPFEQMLAFSSLLQAGAFERFPRLRTGFMESNAGWAPFWLDRLDEHWQRFAWMLEPRPKRLPGEIFRAQCVVGCENEEAMVPYVQQRLGEDRVLWASDYPHFDAEVPGLLDYMRRRSDLSPSQRDAVLCRGALRFYRLDEQAIARSTRARRAGAAHG
jgi:predicted TIM-barrel fold metal-dependent hydrolase